MKFLRDYAEVLLISLSIFAGVAGLWIRAELSDIKARIAVLEENKMETARRLDEIKGGVDELIRMHMVWPNQDGVRKDADQNGGKQP